MRNYDHHRMPGNYAHLAVSDLRWDGRARERCNRPPKNTNKSNLSAVDPRNDPHFVAGCVHCNPLGTNGQNLEEARDWGQQTTSYYCHSLVDESPSINSAWPNNNHRLLQHVPRNRVTEAFPARNGGLIR